MRLFSRRLFRTLLSLAVLGFGVFWFASAPRPLGPEALPAHTADLKNGELLFNAAGCRSCHKPGPDLKDVAAGLPAGGAPFKTPVGTFYPPNLTPDAATGIGNWSDLDFVNAVQRGIGKDGQHLVPAFPYTSYAAMRMTDVLDIKAYLATLTPVNAPARPADIPLAPILRRGLGIWKYLGLNTSPWQPDSTQSESWNRGSYLVNGPGHCSECHTPRTLLMTAKTSAFLAGGPHPGGEGKVPNLRDLIGRGRYKNQKDLADALKYGEELGYEKVSSGGMGEVQTNLSKLPDQDLLAIADYVTSLK
jgi:mono/diheme cytochrome c family protein